jgi:hypothetical protein
MVKKLKIQNLDPTGPSIDMGEVKDQRKVAKWDLYFTLTDEKMWFIVCTHIEFGTLNIGYRHSRYQEAKDLFDNVDEQSLIRAAQKRNPAFGDREN